MLESLAAWLPLSVVVWAAQMVVYHGVGYFFQYCDRNGRLKAFKVRDVDRLTYRQILPRVLVNQVFILLPAMMAVEWLGLAFVGVAHLPVWQFIGTMVLMGVGHDIVQYISHRYVLHNGPLMRSLGHGLHHSTGASKSISACYMSSADFFLEIVLPYLVPLVVLGGGGADVTFHILVAGLGAIGGLYEHSGYDFSISLRADVESGRRGRWAGILAGLASSHAHGEHHRRSSVSFSDGFGSPGICDTLFGTRWDKVAGASRPGPASQATQAPQ
jgi:sterol desaturase/sphingolipid hydroxylase (fatty acid hydroxylase superfamily)